MDFEEFWREYPRKVGRVKAERCWGKMGHDEQVNAFVGLRLWRQTTQWQGNDGQFIPYASTFLAQKRYLDEAWEGCFDEKPNDNRSSQWPMK